MMMIPHCMKNIFIVGVATQKNSCESERANIFHHGRDVDEENLHKDEEL